MPVEIAWKQNILVTDSYLLKLLLVVFGFGSQAFVCGFSRQTLTVYRNLTIYHISNACILKLPRYCLESCLKMLIDIYSVDIPQRLVRLVKYVDIFA